MAKWNLVAMGQAGLTGRTRIAAQPVARMIARRTGRPEADILALIGAGFIAITLIDFLRNADAVIAAGRTGHLAGEAPPAPHRPRAAGLADPAEPRQARLHLPGDDQPAYVGADSYPKFIDHLHLSFTIATAFSPADISAIRPWAKLMTMAEDVISLLVAILVVAGLQWVQVEHPLWDRP